MKFLNYRKDLKLVSSIFLFLSKKKVATSIPIESKTKKSGEIFIVK